jgi:hypothetical protein
MRHLDQYGPLQWARGDPFVHGFKRVRNVAIERTFRRLHPRALNRFLADHAGLAGGTIALTIAYNTPWVVELQIRAAKRTLAADALIVVDNSRDRAARGEIERLCRERAVPYIGLPFNPEWHPCRSHGIAMTWAYYNMVRPLRPKLFAFLDHDLIPLERLDLAAQVKTQPFYGPINVSPWGWNLWAGYCIYDFAAVEAYPLDFNNDNPRLLDTGGRNFSALYRHFDRAAIRFCHIREQALADPLDGSERIVQLIDDLLHVGCVSFTSRWPLRHEPGFFQRIVQACEQGTRLAQLYRGPAVVKAQVAG